MSSKHCGFVGMSLLLGVSLSACATTESAPELTTSQVATVRTTAETLDSGNHKPGGQVIKQVDPCSLLTGSELSRYGEFGQGEYRTYGTGRNCRWQADRDGAAEKVPLVDVIIEDESGVQSLPDLGGGRQSGRAESGRDVVRTSNEDGCVIAMSVSENTRVDVIVSMVEVNDACSIADGLVGFLDRKLPLEREDRIKKVIPSGTH
jgi:hypothetical protein